MWVWVAVKDSGAKKTAKVGWQIAHKTDLNLFYPVSSACRAENSIIGMLLKYQCSVAWKRFFVFSKCGLWMQNQTPSAQKMLTMLSCGLSSKCLPCTFSPIQSAFWFVIVAYPMVLPNQKVMKSHIFIECAIKCHWHSEKPKYKYFCALNSPL